MDEDASRFLDREESWLRFNQRVLELAEDERLPLLERVRFLAIFSTNLDEFYMVRVAGLVRRMTTGLLGRNVAGLLPREALDRVMELTQDLVARQSACFQDKIRPALAAEGIHLLGWDELNDEDHARLRTLFDERIYPILTPLVVDPAHPFPYISGLSLNLAVFVRNPLTGVRRFARVKVPSSLPRFMTVSDQRFVPLEEVIAAHLGRLFTGMEIVQKDVFRITRNQDLEVDEDVTEDLMQLLEQELLRRRFGSPVRLEVADSISPTILDQLVEELELADTTAILRLTAPLDLGGLHIIADLPRRDLKYPRFVPSDTVVSRDESIFAALRGREILVHHPYDSFTGSVERLIHAGAVDPGVQAIKQTLYRTSGDSPIVDDLIDAAEAGKQVVVVVEIKARFDEYANISWARKLEEAGCHVVYGLLGLKTHCKLAMIVRQDSDGVLRRYCHVGTGNYNPKTARIYEDLGLMSADPALAEDVTALFNYLTGYSMPDGYARLLVAPSTLRPGLIERINEETEHAKAGRPARIRFKCNSLVDEEIIDALYAASGAGVPVDIWVRGICALRPEVPELSENIRVRSVLGRFLEHSRVYAFQAGGEQTEMWIGSADLMHRNLDRRVEALVRLADHGEVEHLDGLFDMVMDERSDAWRLGPDGTWTRPRTDDGPAIDVQNFLMAQRRD
ncbi:RNA degradosome polyphosphate kinase [Streptosporangiaceae bacterium NEAU-GS5]|nr:RNA degradosome polyphosphate kinase [Streptosporangiaceae bacterium NEAU-GS5]